MGGGQAELAQQAGGVAGHVAHVVLACVEPAQGQLVQARHRGLDRGGQAGIAVVEAHHVEAALGQHRAEARVPAQQLHAQSHDQEQGRVGRVAEGLVTERDPAADVGEPLAGGLRGGHGCCTVTIVIARSPPGVCSVRSSPAAAPARAWPTGESIEIRCCDGSASVAGTRVKVISLPALASL